VDEWRSVDDRSAFALARRLTREEGLFVGGSTGLIAHVALQIAREIDDPEACIVFLMCDTGERYLSKVFNEEWLRENQLIDPARITVADMVRDKDGGAPEALISVAPETPVRRALAFVTENNVSQLPVLTDGDCVGHVSEATLMARVIEDTTVLDRSVQELMDAPFPVIDSHVDLQAVTRLLTRQNPAVLVRHDGQLGAILTRHDVLRYLTGTL
ncbi:MAG: CBS domain-containing protein, partial [Gemmatimonadota bacterium]|nr:CBS domain-containing protein [Gemmatimonadota bacterium]